MEQIGILHSGCFAGNGLTIMTTQIDGKDIADGCADFALSPGEHHIELSAEQLSPKLEPYVMVGSGSVLGRLRLRWVPGRSKILKSSGHPHRHCESPARSRPDRKSSSSEPREWGGLVGTMSGTYTIVHPRRNTGASDCS